MLKNLINDLLDQAKIENNAFKFNNDFFDLLSIVNHSIEIIEPQARAKNLKVRVKYEKKNEDMLKQVYGDPHRYS